MRQDRNAAYLQSERRYMARGVSAEAAEARVVFASGEGAYLYDLNGKRYLDFSAGILTNALGHGHPHVAKALKEQIDTLWNVHDYPSAQRLRLIQLLRARLPEQLDTFAFLTTGAEAIEACLRIVINYYEKRRVGIASLSCGYHGKTMGAKLLIHTRAAAGLYDNAAHVYAATCFRCPFGRRREDCALLCARETSRILVRQEVKALVFEPIPGAAGVLIPPRAYWEIIGETCRKAGILLIADEVLTGGGRTGSFLACELFGLRPDLVALCKGLASGFPFSVVAGRKEVMDNPLAARPGELSATFSSHPFGLRAAIATLEALAEDGIADHVRALADFFGERLRLMERTFPFIGEARAVGLLAALEFVRREGGKAPDEAMAAEAFRRAMRRGLKLCWGGAVLRLSPPLNITLEELTAGLTILFDVLRELNDEQTRRGDG